MVKYGENKESENKSKEYSKEIIHRELSTRKAI